jgi:hypothetical protein
VDDVSLGFFDDDICCGLGVVSEIKVGDVFVRNYEMSFPSIHNIPPAIADEDDRTPIEYTGREFVPYERNLGHGSHTAAESHEPDGARD